MSEVLLSQKFIEFFIEIYHVCCKNLVLLNWSKTIKVFYSMPFLLCVTYLRSFNFSFTIEMK